MKDVWAVLVHEDACLVVVVVGVATDVIAPVDEDDALAGHRRQPLREDAAGETCADDHVVEGLRLAAPRPTGRCDDAVDQALHLTPCLLPRGLRQDVVDAAQMRVRVGGE